MARSLAMWAMRRRVAIVIAETQHIQFAGLDPVPISDDTLCAAAGLPPSPFIETLKPYRVLRHSALSYELVLGPEGYGAELLVALRWLARVAAAGILASLICEQAIAFVTSTLEAEKPEWKYEELTEHGAAFLADRYRRALEDPIYQRGLDAVRSDATLSRLSDTMQQKLA
jgi:hypothetical protein